MDGEARRGVVAFEALVEAGEGAALRAEAAAVAGGATVTVLARDVARAADVAMAAGLGSDAARSALATCTLLVQATPCGMEGGPPGEAVVAAVELAACAPGAKAADLVYVPRETVWMRAARGAGLRVLDGVGAGMLVHQGAAAFERWFGGVAPVEAMRGALGR